MNTQKHEGNFITRKAIKHNLSFLDDDIYGIIDKALNIVSAVLVLKENIEANRNRLRDQDINNLDINYEQNENVIV